MRLISHRKTQPELLIKSIIKVKKSQIEKLIKISHWNHWTRL